MAEHELFLQAVRCGDRIAIKQNQQSIQHSKNDFTSKLELSIQNPATINRYVESKTSLALSRVAKC